MLRAISPVDGRYASKTEKLQEYFSEFALIKYRVLIEVEYLKELINNDIAQLSSIKDRVPELNSIYKNFSLEDAAQIKKIESVTNHDVKAVEYFIKEKLKVLGLSQYQEWVHFALTSQDINNSAVPLSIKHYLNECYKPELKAIIKSIRTLASRYEGIAMLARTHGQAASPTTLGKEFMVYVERLEGCFAMLEQLPIKAKFGGATGNFNAHKVSFPDTDWQAFADAFMTRLGLQRHHFTTQIAHYDDLAALFHNMSRINTIFIDMARDIWSYISMDYFKQKTIANEVGSSAMPHKVNPIDFENAEGNLGIANAVFSFLADKLPISRLQRDLTDSTVLRNIGVPFAHSTIAFQSIQKGLSKLMLNEDKLKEDLSKNWAVVAEAIQNILRREAYPKPYEALKALTRGQAHITRESIHQFIDTLELSEDIRKELKNISPMNYIGYTK